MIASSKTRKRYGARMSVPHLLRKLGWRVLSADECLALRGGTRDVLLKPRLVEVLQSRRFEYKGEWFALSPGGIDQVVRELSVLNLAEGLLAANERMYGKLALGITVTEFMPDGKRHQPTVAVIDWHDPAANRWDAAAEPAILSTHGTHTRLPGIVCYVNGIPLAVIEAGPSGGDPAAATIDDGIGRQLRNQRNDEIPHLYVYAQLLLALSRDEGRYGTTHTPAMFWARWREEEWSDAQLAAMTQRALPAGGKRTRAPTDRERLLAALLSPSRLLELLRYFILFDRKSGKIVARYQQFFAVRALIARINQRRPDGAREGGVVWHTTGSGKSYTMVFLTKAMLLHDSLKACRMVVVTDRRDLEKQLAANFIDGGAFGSALAARKDGDKARAGSGRELARRIAKGTERIIFTLVHKFATAARHPECYNPSSDLVVLVDEGHRSHGGEIHERMRKSLPRAAYLAFTGTPLLKREKTAGRFGPIVHAYTMQRAVEDGTVAPLLYEERMPELAIDEAAVNRWFERVAAGLAPAQRADLQKKFAGKQAVYGAANRIALIAWDIASHFSEHIRKPGLGLKGQVAVSSRRDAIRYKQYLDDTGLVTSAILMSPPDSREGDGEADEGALPEVRQWWQAEIGGRQDEYEREVLEGFAGDGDPDLLIVVDRLLTGFDEPRNAVLYIDKPLREHNLIQAVARVNRLHAAKRYGMLVDYRGILKQLDTAVRAYQDLEARTQGGYELADIDGLYRRFSTEYKRLPGLHRAVWSCFGEVKNRADGERLRQMLMPKYAQDAAGRTYDARRRTRDDFCDAVTRFGLCLQTALCSRSFFEDHDFSEEDVRVYKDDLRFFSELRATARQDAMETVDYGAYEERIRRMVDEQVVGREVREPEGVYLVHKLGPDDDPARWSGDKARNEADQIRTRLKKTIALELADDPYAQQVFGDLLQRAIADAEALFDYPLRQYALLKAFEDKVDSRALDGMPEALAGNAHAQAYFGICRMALGEAGFAAIDAGRLAGLALEIDRIVRDAVAENSLNPQNIEAVIRKALLPQLFGLMGLERAREAIERIVRVMRSGLGRRMF